MTPSEATGDTTAAAAGDTPRRLLRVVGARQALADSGGIRDKTTALGPPGLTLCSSTERPVTVTDGSNRLVGAGPAAILAGAAAAPLEPLLRDGRAATRGASVLAQADPPAAARGR